MTVAPRDATLDALALLEAHVRGDNEAAHAVLNCCDAWWTANVLANMLAGALRGTVQDPQTGEDAPDRVLTELARLREEWASQYDHQSSGGD